MMDDTGDRLFRAIIEHPGDDDLRLVYSDWLEENGQVERAEFIRVQVGLAGLRLEEIPLDPGCTCLYHGPHEDDCPHHLWVMEYFVRVFRGAALRRREREILNLDNSAVPNERLADGWFGQAGLMRAVTHGADGPFWMYLTVPPWGSTGWPFKLRRGFVSSVTLPLEAWVGRECFCCQGKGVKETPSLLMPCGACRGLGRVDAHGPALVRTAPLETVRVSDREPASYIDGDVWFWYRDMRDQEGMGHFGPIVEANNLPGFIFDRLVSGETGGYYFIVRKHSNRRYSSADDAHADLSRALLAWANEPTGTAAPPSPETRG